MQETMEERELLRRINSLNAKTKGAFETFLIEYNICPLCFRDLQRRGRGKERTVVCTGCGYEPSLFTMPSLVPFGETKIPENQLAFALGLGNTLGRTGTFCVMARSSGTEDLPIRARHISVLTQTVEHPKLMSMLRLGRQLAHDWGFDDHSRESSIIFSNYFGGVLRRVVTEIILSNTKMNLRKIVTVCFALSLKQIRGEEEYHKALEMYGVSEESVQMLEQRLKELEAYRK